MKKQIKKATPSRWFTEKFPSLAEKYGAPVLEEIAKDGVVSVRDIGEDFFAASLGEKGSPNAPTVFLPTEEKFYNYSPSDGVFTHQREPVLISRLSRLLFDCAQACKGRCETQSLEFRFRDAANLSGILRKARGLLDVPHDFFSTNLTEFIPCANGMLQLSDKNLLLFSPTYRRRNKLAVRFDVTAKCPLFLDVLMRPALERDELDLLQRWCGLALIGENLAQRILILTGTAGGGKGTFIRVLNGIIGQTNLAALRPHLLGERFELGRFLGKTLLYGADVPENFLNQRGASILKSLTGGDPVTLEFKNSNESPCIICNFNVILTCNSRLTVHLEGDTDAWQRRLTIIEYRKAKPEKVIADLDKRILTSEASGVLNWMLEGLDKLRADGWQLHLTAAQQGLVNNLLLESDGLTLFVSEALARVEGGRLTVPICFDAYIGFCNERGWTALTRKKFGDLIGDAVTRQHRLTVRHDVRDENGKAQRGWVGLQFRENFPRPSGKPASGVSENPPDDAFPDGPDGDIPVGPTKIPKAEQEADAPPPDLVEACVDTHLAAEPDPEDGGTIV
ncbi:MAG: phage/plasmid primase, P4 family [Limisphaerales bacterium]